MTTTDPTPLQERIARELYARGNDELRKAWDNPRNLHQVPQWREKYRELSAAVLPIVAVEVRKAKAEALREAAENVSFTETEDDYDRLNYSTSREFYEDMAQDWLRACAIATETGDSDEHR